jgi:hypothetical protein
MHSQERSDGNSVRTLRATLGRSTIGGRGRNVEKNAEMQSELSDKVP